MGGERLAFPEQKVVFHIERDAMTRTQRQCTRLAHLRKLCFKGSRIDGIGKFAKQSENDGAIRCVTLTGKRQRAEEFRSNACCGEQITFAYEFGYKGVSGAHWTDRMRTGGSYSDFKDLEKAGFHWYIRVEGKS